LTGTGEWFRRIGDIPGLDYAPPLPIDRTAIPGHDLEPEVRRMDFGGMNRAYLSWGMREVLPAPGEPEKQAWTSLGAPVSEHLREPLEASRFITSAELLGRLWEALELPGGGDDYHRVLERVWARLRSNIRREPEAATSVEELAWLDIRLVLAYPDAVRVNYDGETKYRPVSAFSLLERVYETEGFLSDALRVAELQAQHWESRRLEELRKRLQVIRDESAG
jgi:hypothetical protein